MLGKNDFLFDRRLVERFIKRGAISREDYTKYLGTLADAASKAEPLASGEPSDTERSSG